MLVTSLNPAFADVTSSVHPPADSLHSYLSPEDPPPADGLHSYLSPEDPLPAAEGYSYLSPDGPSPYDVIGPVTSHDPVDSASPDVFTSPAAVFGTSTRSSSGAAVYAGSGGPVAAVHGGSGGPVAVTETGRLEGVTREATSGGQVDAWLGIPYARPPLGGLRFQPPQPAQAWDGVREAKTQPNACWQVRDERADVQAGT